MIILLNDVKIYFKKLVAEELCELPDLSSLQRSFFVIFPPLSFKQLWTLIMNVNLVQAIPIGNR